MNPLKLIFGKIDPTIMLKDDFYRMLTKDSEDRDKVEARLRVLELNTEIMARELRIPRGF